VAVEAQTVGEAAVAQDSPVATAEAVPTIGLTLSGPTSIPLEGLGMVTLILRHSEPIGELGVEITIPILHMRVAQDADPERPGVQVITEMREGLVELNEVGDDGVLRYRIVGIGSSTAPTRTLLAIPLRGVTEGYGDLAIQNAEYLSPDGRIGNIAMEPDSLIISVEDQMAPTPTPTSVVMPTPTTDLPTPTLPSDTVATPSCDYPSLPPLSEVVDTPITPQPGSIYYRIQHGQTLYRLSQSFDVSVETIMAANDLTDVQAVPAGALLRIPTSPPEGQAAYLVSSKETLYSIAKAFGCTVEELGMLNAIGPTEYGSLDVGDYLVLLP
jgi:LysM repeat protein